MIVDMKGMKKEKREMSKVVVSLSGGKEDLFASYKAINSKCFEVFLNMITMGKEL